MDTFPNSGRVRKPPRTPHRSIVVAATAVVAMMLPIFYVGVNRALATDPPPEPGISLWADSTHRSDGITWSASKSEATGLVHSNDDLRISGSKNELLGGTEYVTGLRVSGHNNVIEPAPVRTAASTAPIEFDIADYRPGGAAAQAAGNDYFDHSAECDARSKCWGWPRVIHLRADELAPGLHYVRGDVIISGALPDQPITIVADGKIAVVGSDADLGPAYVDGLLLYSNSSSQHTLRIAGTSADLDGFVYAPRGTATITGARHDLRCAVVAERISIKGSKHTFVGDATCGLAQDNAVPTAVDDEFSVAEDAVLVIDAPGVLANDTDVDGDPLTAALADDVANGTLELGDDGSFTYTPNANFFGDDTLTYVANDGMANSGPATVTITVTPVNDPPIADANGPYAGTIGAALTLDGSGSSDLDGTVVSYDWDFGDGTTGDGIAPDHTYADVGLFTVTLTVTDDAGLTDTTTTVADITPAPNTPPTAVDDDYSLDEDIVLMIAAPGVLANDTDDDGDTLTAVLVADVTSGSLSLAADGSFTYTPGTNHFGDDTFTYVSDDGTDDSNIATVTLTVAPLNDPPVADPNGPYTGPVGGSLSFDGTGSSDPEDSVLTYDWDFGDGTTAAGPAPDHTYAAVGTFTVTLTVTDDGGLSDTATTTAIITDAPNTSPVAVDDEYSVDEDTVLSVAAPGVLGNDIDVDGDALTAVLVDDVSNGALVFGADGSFTYTPDLDFFGDETYTYIVNDGTDDSGLGTVTITVTPVNDSPVADANGPYSGSVGDALTFDGSGSFDLDGAITSYDWDFGDGNTGTGLTADHTYTGPGLFTVTLTVTDDGGLTDTTIAVADIAPSPNTPPVAGDDVYTVDEDTVLTVATPGVLGNDTDADGDALTAVLVGDVTNGTLTLDTDGSLTYTPDANYFGGDSFTYIANDGTDDSTTATANITVLPVNDPPVAVDDEYTVDEDTTLTVPAAGVLTNDTDVESDALTGALIADVTNGTLTLNSDGSFTYLPTLNYSGDDSFTYVVSDGSDDSGLGTVTITVTPVNDPPIADANGPYVSSVGTAVTFDGSGSFDLDGAIVSYDWDFGDGNTSTGVTPDHTYTGPGLFTVTLTVTDDGGLTDATTGVADIAPTPNTPPVAVDDDYSTSEDATLTVTVPGVLDNDTDVDGDTLTAALVDDVTNGTLTLNSDGSFTYLPDANYFGGDSFTYAANDGAADSYTATVTLTVLSVNDPPVADAGPDQNVTVGDLVALDASGSSDPVEGDPLGYIWTFETRPVGSTAALTGADTVGPTFAPNLPGDYVVELTVDDGNGGFATDTVTVTAARIGMTISLEDSLVGVGRTTNGTITLDNPAPPGGITVTLSLDTAIATVDPVGVPISEGATEGTFVLAGIAVGETTITGNSPVTETATADVQVTDSLISIDDIPIIAPDESADLPVSITKPAPPGGLTIMLESLDPTIAVTEATVFVPEGLYVPTSNPQITGVSFGTTQIKATALAFGPDVRDVTVALTVTLTPAELDIPELWTLQVTAQLSAPAPSGGVTLDLSLDQPLATAPASVFIPAGQTLSGPIDVTGGTTFGTTTLRAGGAGLIEGTTVINVIDTPDVWATGDVDGPGQTYGSTTYRLPLEVGVDLQIDARVRFEVAPPGPVDVVVSVPAGSGVLLSASPTEVGSESLVVATGFTSTSASPYTGIYYLQGTIQGDDLADDVPVTIDVFETGTTTPVGYEQADMPSAVDVGPSGFSFPASTDLDVPTFPNEQIDVRAYLLYDGESGTLHNRRWLQDTRGGHTITVELTNSDPGVGDVVAPAVFTGGGYQAYAAFDGLTAGTTTLGIVQPTGHTAPANGYTTRTLNVTAPDVWATGDVDGPGQTYGSTTYRLPLEVGVDLQIDARVRFEVAPPGPVDVVVSVPAGSGVLLSASPTEVGSESLVVATGFTSTSASPYTGIYYLQGTIQGDDLADDVPVTIDVFETGTTTPVGYEQADMPSAVDVGPSGFSFPASTDLDVPTFPNEQIDVRAYLLYDGESGTLHNRRWLQDTRGGHTITVELTNSDPGVGDVVAPAVFTGGGYQAYAAFDGLTAGTTTLGIVQPTGHTAPANGYTTRTLNVTAPDVWATGDVDGPGQTYGSTTYRLPLEVGVDLQIDARVRFEVAPPGPVDVVVSVPAGSGVLLSASPTEVGSESLVVATGFTSTSASPYTGIYYLQGTIQGDDLADDVPVTIDVFETGTTTPVGYEQADMPSAVDVGPSGFSFPSATDLNTTTFSPNEQIDVRAYLLYDGESGTLHNRRWLQDTRGGHTITVELTNSDPGVGDVVAPAVFTGGGYQAYAAFDALTAGTTQLGITQPTGHTAPANGYTTRNVNVDAPDLTLERYVPTSGWLPSPDENLGRDLQVERRIGLEVAPPAPGVDVTIDVVAPSVALISTDPNSVGSSSITLPLVTGTYTPLIYVQGLTLDQGTELRVSAPGYDQWITTVQVVDSGFYISTNDFTTTVDASNRNVRVYPASLDTLQRVDETQQVRGGLSYSIDVTSSDPTVGAITVSPLVFTGTDAYLNTQFDPIAVGTTTISIDQPPGFLPPAGETAIVATVEPA